MTWGLSRQTVGPAARADVYGSKSLGQASCVFVSMELQAPSAPCPAAGVRASASRSGAMAAMTPVNRFCCIWAAYARPGSRSNIRIHRSHISDTTVAGQFTLGNLPARSNSSPNCLRLDGETRRALAYLAVQQIMPGPSVGHGCQHRNESGLVAGLKLAAAPVVPQSVTGRIVRSGPAALPLALSRGAPGSPSRCRGLCCRHRRNRSARAHGRGPVRRRWVERGPTDRSSAASCGCPCCRRRAESPVDCRRANTACRPGCATNWCVRRHA